LDAVNVPNVQSWWFDPRYGGAHPICGAGNEGTLTFTPPWWGRGQDWVLVPRRLRQKLPASGIAWRQ
jgi:hypothetical protein